MEKGQHCTQGVRERQRESNSLKNTNKTTDKQSGVGGRQSGITENILKDEFMHAEEGILTFTYTYLKVLMFTNRKSLNY